MLHLKGLSLSAKIGGTVTISSIPWYGKFLGATCRQKIVIENDLGDTIEVDDQIIEAEVK